MDIKQFYYHLTHNIVPGPQSISYFLPLILLPTALLIPRTVLLRWQNSLIFLPAILAATAHAWTRMGCIDVISVNAVLWSFYFLLLRDPWKDFRQVQMSAESNGYNGPGIQSNGSTEASRLIGSSGGGDDVGSAASNIERSSGTKYNIQEQCYPSTLKHRIPWVLRLLASIRLNNWMIGISSHDKYQPPAPAFQRRRDFLIQALLSFTRGYLLLDLTSAYTHYDPYFREITISISSPLPSPFSQIPFMPPPFLRAMTIGLQAWVLISQMFYLPCILPISLNYLGTLPNEWSPHTWAAYFGQPSTIFLYGVRGFWGQYWHQTMRHSCSGPGYALAEFFKLKRGGVVRYMLINIVAFGLSGIVHTGLVPPEPLTATVTPNRIRFYVGGFFWMQPVGMLIEVLSLRVLEVTGMAEHWRQHQTSTLLALRLAFTGIWVILWFSLSLPLLAEAARQLEYTKVWLVPLSFWTMLQREEYVMW